MGDFLGILWDPRVLLALLSVPVLIFLNGFFVAAEFALVAIRKTKVEEMVNRNIAGAHLVQKTLQNLDQTIAATQLGITLASIALGFVGEPVLARVLEPLFSWVDSSWQAFTVHGLATTFSFFLITFLHVVFGELIPKTLALRDPERSSLVTAGPMLLFGMIAKPLIRLMNETAAWFIRCMGIKAVTEQTLAHSIEELKLLIEDTEEAGIIESEQAEFLQNVFLLSSKKVGDCMIPKEKMAVLDLKMPLSEVMEAVRAGGHTRMPVFDGDKDNIVGIVNTKDLLYVITLQGVALLEDALYPVIFLKPEEPINTALKLFKTNHRHLAVVRNSAGEVQGIITLEDIVEEIVGEIEDEQDNPQSSRMLRAFSRKKIHTKT